MASILNATTTSGLVTSADNSGSLQLQTNNGTTAVTIDTSQNVGIGTSSLSGKLSVLAQASTIYGNFDVTTAGFGYFTFKEAGTTLGYIGPSAIGSGGKMAIASDGANPLVFATNASERMRITSGGNVLVGTTDVSLTTGIGYKYAASATDPYIGIVQQSSTNSNTNYHLYSTGAAAYRFYVGLAGTIYATSTTITALSDARLKENIKDIDVGLDSIMALKPRKFDWKDGKGKNKKGDRGWIAQEFEQVFPDMIDTWKDPAPEGEEPYKSVNADLIPVLVKAIQEQQAQIEELKADLQALKGTK